MYRYNDKLEIFSLYRFSGDSKENIFNLNSTQSIDDINNSTCINNRVK